VLLVSQTISNLSAAPVVQDTEFFRFMRSKRPLTTTLVTTTLVTTTLVTTTLVTTTLVTTTLVVIDDSRVGERTRLEVLLTFLLMAGNAHLSVNEAVPQGALADIRDTRSFETP
jgi:hypothetical protein